MPGDGGQPAEELRMMPHLRGRLAAVLAATFIAVGTLTGSALAYDPPAQADEEVVDSGNYPALDNVPPPRHEEAGEPAAVPKQGTAGVTASGQVGTVAGPSAIVVEDGVTQPVFSYANAIRERVWVPVPGVDQNNDGVIDRVALDIIRPAETNQGLKVPAIIDVSPYYTSLGRGNDTEFLHSVSATQADKFPLYYDNYFVPRGYAFIAAQAVGTAWSTGCPLHGGPGDVAGFKAVIDWLRGRLPAYDSRTTSTTQVFADWDNGKNAMFGKSYDGTFANGVAATGVEGLTTIVPISGISEWYDYSRSNGIRQSQAGTHYPASLSSSITSNTSTANLGVAPPSNNASCSASRAAMSAVDGDADGNINPFWDDRNYNNNVSNVQASVFVSHGLNDDNVKTDQFGEWWAGLAANNVPRKIWLGLVGHVDPFDYRRSVWVSTIHRWYDYWLQGIQNGIMDEPRATVETSTNVFEDYADWPLPGTQNIDVFLRGGQTTSVPGSLALNSGGTLGTRLLTDSPGQSETTMVNLPLGSQTNRLVFITPVLSQPLRISGTAIVDMYSSFNKSSAYVGAVIADYAPTSFVKASRSGDGISTSSSEDCWGESFGLDDACYRIVNKTTQTINPLTGSSPSGYRVTRGILDAVNRDDYSTDSPLVPGQQYELKFPLLATDYTFPAGHRIGITLVSNYSGYGTTNTTSPTAQITVDTFRTKVILPVVGGYAAALATGAIPDDAGPEITIDSPEDAVGTGPGLPGNYALGSSPLASYSCSDVVSGIATCTGPVASGSAFDTSTVGYHTFTVNATDLSGNASSASRTYNVYIPTISALSDAHGWLGLKNGDDQGTNFDLQVELLKNGDPVASGLTRCITAVTRNPTAAKEAIVPWSAFPAVPVTPGDVLALRVSARIGTNPNDTKCAGHNSAVGVRLYYDATNRSSRFDATIDANPSVDLYLHSDGAACINAESVGVTSRYLDNSAPVAAAAKCKDAGVVNFAGGNKWSEIGTWSLATLP
jgi:X-Pro dipeptidyl-peptidase